MIPTIDTVFAALANPTRLELLRLLRDEGRQPVHRLAAHFAMRRPSVSEHLKLLRDVGLVCEQRQGRHRYYYLEPAPLQSVQAWLAPYETFWRARFTNLETLLGETDHE